MAADNNTKTIEGVTCAGFNAGLFDRMRRMNRSWLERLREIRQIESEFGARLLAANSPAEASTVCHEWMAKRLETVASEQQAFTTAWLGLVSETMDSPRPAGAARNAGRSSEGR
jgi:hypothetical protein